MKPYQIPYVSIGSPPSKIARGFQNYYLIKYVEKPVLNPKEIKNEWNKLMKFNDSMNDEEINWNWKWANKLNYKLYLDSKYWLIISSKKKLDVGCCENCGSSKNLEVHHTSYNIKGNEHNNMDKLIVVCKECHKKIHGIVKAIYNSKMSKSKNLSYEFTSNSSNSLDGTLFLALLKLPPE
jgi:predicted HNH restriction endonuclease